MKKALNITAILLIIIGFGIVHNPSRIVEITGSLCVGAGALYYIVLIYLSSKEKK